MQSAHLHRRPQKKRSASALLGLLIVIALAAAIYFAQLYLKKTAKDPDTCHDLAPWKEWRLRQSSEKPAQELFEQQPDITNIILYDTNVRLEREPRGELRLTIHPDGSVGGMWYGDYYNNSKVNFDILRGDFKGRTYPRKIYRDEQGLEDKSKLYFITKGTFLLAETNFKKDTVFHRGGDIYVRGWVEPDYKIMGEIIITSNEKYFETFTWQASRPSKE